jgi:hypothetical protein
MPGFPVFRGIVFWQDFVNWRTSQNRSKKRNESQPRSGGVTVKATGLPARAARILMEAC